MNTLMFNTNAKVLDDYFKDMSNNYEYTAVDDIRPILKCFYTMTDKDSPIDTSLIDDSKVIDFKTFIGKCFELVNPICGFAEDYPDSAMSKLLHKVLLKWLNNKISDNGKNGTTQIQEELLKCPLEYVVYLHNTKIYEKANSESDANALIKLMQDIIIENDSDDDVLKHFKYYYFKDKMMVAFDYNTDRTKTLLALHEIAWDLGWQVDYSNRKDANPS